MTLRRFYHYSNMPVTEIYGPLEAAEPRLVGKPNGFWLSDCDEGDGWYEWCEKESFRQNHNIWRTTVMVDMTNILLLNTALAIRYFHIKYGGDRESSYSVDWAAVANKYSGIVISPYQWELRISDIGWYCASGCIWDTNVARVEGHTQTGLFPYEPEESSGELNGDEEIRT